ncbi:hypothetical protein, partial [Streptomyces sp. ISL-11]|uniref:hypothetical protein n=1 Tax=Streptomyces sp. ISL-11 TaxID=2819174 RepID=UPI001BE7434B
TTAAARAAAAGPYGEAMITGSAALALHRFTSVPPLLSLDRIDVLVPRTRRLRTTGFVRLVRAHTPPRARMLTGVPVAPVPRAVADAVSQLGDATTVRRLLIEAVREGHCEAAAIVGELTRARLMGRPHVMEAVDTLLAESRAVAEGRLYDLVRDHRLPAPLWNVDLRLPGGTFLGRVDAFWPEHSVAVEIDARTPRQEDEVQWSAQYRKREHLERLGVTVVHVTPRKLGESPDQQGAVVRTALMASADRDPAAYLVVLPR